MAQEEDAPNEYSRDLPRKDGDSSLQLVLDQLATLNAKFASANLISTKDALTLSQEDLGMYAVEERVEDVNYVANNSYSNTYNPGWKNHPNLSYKSNNVENPVPNNFRASDNSNQRIPPSFAFQSRGPNQTSNYRAPGKSYINSTPPVRKHRCSLQDHRQPYRSASINLSKTHPDLFQVSLRLTPVNMSMRLL
ncbi:PREDICTED: uncharacterized protein LOC104818204 isoform X2 [Tarenaya hassleriana]|uniref:uncharacterized protein LOC104818204 isoform X2 n=1 Tax=Tarenaya hassleriana TaxID=28532 RepID=UPI00053C89A6|nr:PREDICTED: uncharacterized protein LOC104818204 isoform X2 [Tarenaya hassleriana]